MIHSRANCFFFFCFFFQPKLVCAQLVAHKWIFGLHVFEMLNSASNRFKSIFRRDIPIGVSLYSTPTGTAYIEQLVESKKSTTTAKKGNTLLS